MVNILHDTSSMQASRFEQSLLCVRTSLPAQTQNQLQNDDHTDGTHERWIVVTRVAWSKMRLEYLKALY